MAAPWLFIHLFDQQHGVFAHTGANKRSDVMRDQCASDQYGGCGCGGWRATGGVSAVTLLWLRVGAWMLDSRELAGGATSGGGGGSVAGAGNERGAGS